MWWFFNYYVRYWGVSGAGGVVVASGWSFWSWRGWGVWCCSPGVAGGGVVFQY